MSNVCKLCGQQVGPLTTEGLCDGCSASSKSGTGTTSPVSAAKQPLPADSRAGFHYILAVLLVLSFSWMLSRTLFDDSPHAPFSGSTHHAAVVRLLESLLGVRGTEAVLSIFMLVITALLGNYSVRGREKTTKIIALTVLAAIGLTILGRGLQGAIVRWQEETWRRDVAGKIGHLADGVAESTVPSCPAIRDKVLVWDCTTDGLSSVQTMLPKERQGKSSDPRLTFVLILATNDKEQKPFRMEGIPTYDDGLPHYRRTLTVAAVNWPEQQVLGVWPVEGDLPDMYVLHGADKEKGAVIGNTDEPLKRWILGTVPTGQGQ